VHVDLQYRSGGNNAAAGELGLQASCILIPSPRDLVCIIPWALFDFSTFSLPYPESRLSHRTGEGRGKRHNAPSSQRLDELGLLHVGRSCGALAEYGVRTGTKVNLIVYSPTSTFSPISAIVFPHHRSDLHSMAPPPTFGVEQVRKSAKAGTRLSTCFLTNNSSGWTSTN
jgi:hypothetical protein